MSRVSLLVVVMVVLVALSAAEDTEKHHAEEVAKPSPLTAIHLPSESLFRAVRALQALSTLSSAKSVAATAAATAARALADNVPSSLNLSHNMVQTLALAGAVVVGLVGSAGLLAIVLPMFGFRLCYLFGTCDTYAHAYLAPSAYDAYAYSQPVYASTAYAKSYDGATNELPYGYEGYQHAAQPVATYPATAGNTVAANAYQKRSLEYAIPILKMLSNAYEKYNHPAQTKSVEGGVGGKAGSGATPAESKAE